MRHARKKVKRAARRTVRAAEGLRMPLHPSVRVVDGARPRVFTPETVITVLDSRHVRNRVAAGDWVEVAAANSAEPEPEPEPKKSSKKSTETTKAKG